VIARLRELLPSTGVTVPAVHELEHSRRRGLPSPRAVDTDTVAAPTAEAEVRRLRDDEAGHAGQLIRH
jgi:hypothetical protein